MRIYLKFEYGLNNDYHKALCFNLLYTYQTLETHFLRLSIDIQCVLL